jgi:hypothetical protein
MKEEARDDLQKILLKIANNVVKDSVLKVRYGPSCELIANKMFLQERVTNERDMFHSPIA